MFPSLSQLPMPLVRPSARLILKFLPVALLLALGGCATSTDEVHPIHVAGGRVIGIPFGPNGPRPGHANGYEVAYVGVGPGATDRELLYRFALTVPAGVTPQNIKVEDISDDEAYLLIDDLHPWLEERVWHIESLSIKSDDPRLRWVLNVSPSIRVYRFTVTDDGGRRSLLYQLYVYPNYLKAAIRQKWGEKY